MNEEEMQEAVVGERPTQEVWMVLRYSREDDTVVWGTFGSEEAAKRELGIRVRGERTAWGYSAGGAVYTIHPSVVQP
jgi:hypothetical protein